jgi:hypothetical protein
MCLAAVSASAQPPGKPSTPFKGQSDGPQGFSVVLVLGDSKATTTAVDDSVPPAARKALADMKDFLPYKGYRLLDAQWILGSTHATTRLRGVDEQEYQLTLRSGIYVGQLRVVFQLQEPGAADTAVIAAEDGQRRAQLARLQDQINHLEQEAAALRARAGADAERGLQVIGAQIAEIKRQMTAADAAATTSRGRSVIDTSFNMDVGETVVVGTSRVRGGDKALIALLTAVPKGTTLKRED